MSIVIWVTASEFLSPVKCAAIFGTNVLTKVVIVDTRNDSKENAYCHTIRIDNNNLFTK